METMTSKETTKERGADNPSVWNAAPLFNAYLNGFRVQVRITHGNSLCIHLDYKMASALEVYPAMTVAVTPQQAIEWARIHVPAPDKEIILAYFTRLDSLAHWQYRDQLEAKRQADMEQREKENLEWMRSPEFRQLQFKALLMEMSKPEVA